MLTATVTYKAQVSTIFLYYLQSSHDYRSSLKQFGGMKKFSCFIGQYPDAKFMLEEYKAPPKLSGFIKGTPYRVKICSENNFEVSEM